MDYEDYVKALADVLSGDPDRVRAGNKALFEGAVEGDEREKNPLLALADAADKG
jgi:hypothetical protein